MRDRGAVSGSQAGLLLIRRLGSLNKSTLRRRAQDEIAFHLLRVPPELSFVYSPPVFVRISSDVLSAQVYSALSSVL
jgi:hypothetical protein